MKYKALHKLSYGVYIISTSYNGKYYGYIGNTVFQVTSSPPQIAISCHKDNVSTSMILKSRIFSVSVLRKETDTSLIGRFGFMSSDTIDKFANINTIKAVTGAPVVTDDTIAWFDCEVVSVTDAGSHIIIIGLIKDSGLLSDEDPLTYGYYREKYKMLSPANAPTYIEEAKLEKEDIPGKGSEAAGEEGLSDNDIYTCSICGYRYDPAEGDPASNIPPGTSFSELPDDYKCPVCNAGKEYFKRS
jgi:rubredoxin/flavin reductase (DIM6/NTAB) family NADH-FMN oxidoreductase RutF